jgi:hypothetical protein
LAEDPGLAEDLWWAADPEPPAWAAQGCGPLPPWPGDPEPDDAEWVAAWLDRELAKAARWLDADPEWADEPVRGPREVLKAGRWDRSRGDGGGFAAGGVADRLAPGPVLAGLARDRWAGGLAALSDDELIGVLIAARRLASWAAAMELAAVGELWARRTAEEDAGDTGAAVHADDEIAAALTLTRHAASQVLDLAVTLGRLPLTAAALAAGEIDLPRATVIADAVTGLTVAHAAAVDRAVIAAAPGQTTGQLRAAAQRAVLAADPGAARRRKEEAQREARVERWAEPAGTAALAGRDLPPASVLAADANLTALAKQLKAAGVAGTMDTLRAQVYLALLSGVPVSSLLPSPAAGTGSTGPAVGNPSSTSPAVGSPSSTSSAVGGPSSTSFSATSGGAPGGSVNLTLPLATWLGLADTPGHAAGYGPLDASDSRALANALAAQAGTHWCLTVTGRDGRPVAHGCARAGPSPGRSRSQPATGTRNRPAAGARDGPAAGARDGPAAGARDGPAAGPRDGPRSRAHDRTWTVTLTWLDRDECDHAQETPVYQPTAGLRHLVRIRHATCVFPGCRRPAAQCDADHTLAYDHGGRTCLCNLAPLCRHHHQVKQMRGWTLQQATHGTMTWTTPARRRYTTAPTSYPT